MAAPHGFIERLAELSAAGQPFVAVTLVSTVGSTPQDVGTKMLVDAEGLVFVTVGGGRFEHRAIEHDQALIGDATSAATTLVEWNLKRDVGMTCGGSVKLLFEAYNGQAWRIAIFGAGHVAQALVRVLVGLECHIKCIDPRAEWLDKLPEAPQLVVLQRDAPQTEVASLADDVYVLCMTMGHRTDRPILETILRSGRQFPYLGVIGSEAKRKVLIRELIEAGIGPDMADSFRCPIGLPLGTNQPGEIAVSIAAELIQTRDAIRVTA